MKTFLLTALLIAFSTIGFAQQKLSTYTSKQFRVTNYGEYQESSTGSPTVVTLNLESNTINIQSESGLISRFVEGNMNQSISGTRNGRAGTRTFGTNEGFIFTFDAYARKILITKEGTNFKMHALWLDEVKF